MNPTDFSLAALYAALDAQRRARGLSWSQAAREINRVSVRSSLHPISPSTLTGLRTKAMAEADGVLQMLLWLNRTPESFVAGHTQPDDASARLPHVPPHQVLRFDTRGLHAALNARRMEKNMTWARAAAEIGLSTSNLTHLAKGGRTSFPQVMRIVDWLAQPAARFTRLSDW